MSRIIFSHCKLLGYWRSSKWVDCHFFAKIHAYYWEEPFLFKYCADEIIRECVPEQEQSGILSHCHDNACGGHFASHKKTMKVIQSGFWWPSLFKDAHSMCKGCDRCQRLGKLWFLPSRCISWLMSSWCSLVEVVINKIYNLLHHELG